MNHVQRAARPNSEQRAFLDTTPRFRRSVGRGKWLMSAWPLAKRAHHAVHRRALRVLPLLQLDDQEIVPARVVVQHLRHREEGFPPGAQLASRHRSGGKRAGRQRPGAAGGVRGLDAQARNAAGRGARCTPADGWQFLRRAPDRRTADPECGRAIGLRAAVVLGGSRIRLRERKSVGLLAGD